MRLDATDWTILRELYRWDAANLPRGALRVPLRELSARTRMHRNTVQARLSAMRRSGVLEGIVFEPRPSVLGLARAGTLFDVPGITRDQFTDVLSKAPNVSSAVLTVGAVFLHSWHDRGVDVGEWQARVAKTLGSSRLLDGYRSSEFPVGPGDSFAPTPLDLRVMRELRRRPGSSLAEVGRRLGVTARTAELRAKRLIEAEAGAMLPLFRPSRAEGALFVQFVAWHGTRDAHRGLARAFPDRIIGPFARGQIASVAVGLDSIDKVEARREAAQRVPGVGPVTAYLVRDVTYPPSFEAWLSARFDSVQSNVARQDNLPSAMLRR